MEQSKEIGSQLRRSIAFFHKKTARRTKPGMLSADYIVGLTDGVRKIIKLKSQMHA